MYILTIEKFESFFRLEADVINVIHFPQLSRFESDGASANLLFFLLFFQHLQTTAGTSLKYAIACTLPQHTDYLTTLITRLVVFNHSS
jgi:hypothetical protein